MRIRTAFTIVAVGLYLSAAGPPGPPGRAGASPGGERLPLGHAIPGAACPLDDDADGARAAGARVAAHDRERVASLGCDGDIALAARHRDGLAASPGGVPGELPHCELRAVLGRVVERAAKGEASVRPDGAKRNGDQRRAERAHHDDRHEGHEPHGAGVRPVARH